MTLPDFRRLAWEAALPHVPKLSGVPIATLYYRMFCVLLVLGSLLAGSAELCISLSGLEHRMCTSADVDGPAGRLELART